MINRLKNHNWTYIVVMAIVRGVYMPGALIISFGHIISAGEDLGLTGWQAFTAPFFLDGFAVLGMIGRSHAFLPETRRWALWMQVGAGAASLIANVYAGHNAGERIYGFLIVAGFVVAERFAERAYAAPIAADLAKAKRSEAARKGAATKAAKKAAATPAAAKPRKTSATRRVRQLAPALAPAAA